MTGLSESTIKRYWKPFKTLIEDYNKELVWGVQKDYTTT
jgi:hypothetical protein